MWADLIKMIESIKGILRLILPLVVFVFSVLATYSILKWGTRLNLWFKDIFKSPLTVVFWILVLVILATAYIMYVDPLFK